jgi:small multidrug resistance pump
MKSTRDAGKAPSWCRGWLVIAGLYNLAWGTLMIALPNLLFDLSDIERMNYPEIWQCVGMIVGVYGIGYLIAAGDPRTHWPIVLVGLLGKILGPIGFAAALLKGTFPPIFGLTILTNDILWWIPFGMILWDTANRRRELLSLPH